MSQIYHKILGQFLRQDFDYNRLVSNDSVFRDIALASFLVTVLIALYHRVKAARASNEPISRKDEGLPVLISLRLAGLVMWASTLMLLIAPGLMQWSTLALPQWLRWVGAALCAVSVALVYWVFHSLGKNVTDTVMVRKNNTLVTHGPYRWVRHPLYSVILLIATAMSLLLASWFLAAVGLVVFAILVVRTSTEEAKLVERHGDRYRDYMKRTGRFLPRLT